MINLNKSTTKELFGLIIKLIMLFFIVVLCNLTIFAYAMHWSNSVIPFSIVRGVLLLFTIILIFTPYVYIVFIVKPLKEKLFVKIFWGSSIVLAVLSIAFWLIIPLQ